MKESEYIQSFFHSTNLSEVRQTEVIARINGFSGSASGPTDKRDLLGLPVIKIKNKLPKLSDFWKIIDGRSTKRNFSNKNLSFKNFQILLSGAIGRNRIEQGNYLRRSPSAGGLFGLQFYFINRSIESLDLGIYYVDESKDVLFQISNKIPNDSKLSKMFYFDPEDLKKIDACLVVCGDVSMTSEKYGIRAIRYAMLDAGHAMQNFCLCAGKLKINFVPLGGFDEEKIAQIFDIQNKLEFPVYTAVFGR